MDSSAIVWLFCLIAIFGFSINGLLKRTVLALETDLGTRRRDSEMSDRSSSSASDSLRSSRDGGSCFNSSSEGLLSRTSLTSNLPRIILMRNVPTFLQSSSHSICFQDESDYLELGILSDYKDLPPPDYEEAQRLLMNDEEQPPPSYTEYIEMLNSVTVTV